ncbi:MAG: hypothetical protein ABJC63_13770 [Gemmatimonadales bacterium]
MTDESTDLRWARMAPIIACRERAATDRAICRYDLRERAQAAVGLVTLIFGLDQSALIDSLVYSAARKQ